MFLKSLVGYLHLVGFLSAQGKAVAHSGLHHTRKIAFPASQLHETKCTVSKHL